jgi:hypothetical protein
MRLSTSQTPRIISCAEELPNHVALPRGCCDDARELLDEYGVRLDIEDQRTEEQAIDVAFQGKLTDLQITATRALLKHDTGVFVAPPGVGKTVVGIHLIAARARSTLILVHRRPLMEQWVAQLTLFLGIPTKQIGRIGANRHKVTGTIDVAMIQSLVRGDRVEDLVAGYGHVIVDECHHLPAVSFERVLAELKARYVTGLTATPQCRDGQTRGSCEAPSRTAPVPPPVDDERDDVPPAPRRRDAAHPGPIPGLVPRRREEPADPGGHPERSSRREDPYRFQTSRERAGPCCVRSERSCRG